MVITTPSCAPIIDFLNPQLGMTTVTENILRRGLQLNGPGVVSLPGSSQNDIDLVLSADELYRPVHCQLLSISLNNGVVSSLEAKPLP